MASHSRSKMEARIESRLDKIPCLDWLLDSDPAIGWQAMRDLTDASTAEVAAERARVSREGIGAKIIASQGRTAGGTALMPACGCRLSIRCFYCARPASTGAIPRSSRPWLVSRAASGGISLFRG
jgi:hypothetical protein